MQKTKKHLALLLAVLMMISVFPTTGYAAEGENLSEEHDASFQDEVYNVEDDVVYFNLGKEVVKIGNDQESDYDFDEDGNYTIILEDNAFFPYEVQFTYAGAAWEEWFLTPEDTVVIGEHIFSVYSEVTDPTALTQIGVTIGDEYFPSYPETKNFTDGAKADSGPRRSRSAAVSITNLYLDLTWLMPLELKEVDISTIAENLSTSSYYGTDPNVDADDISVWAKWGYRDEDGETIYINDNYTVVGDDTSIDLSDNSISYTSYVLELIVGTADQLNDQNIRYRVNISRSMSFSPYDLFAADVSIATDSSRKKLDSSFIDFSSSSYYSAKNVLSIASSDDGWDGTGLEDAFLSLSFNTVGYNLYQHSRSTATPGDDFAVKVYEGYFETLDEITEAGAADITGDIWNIDDVGTSGGYQKDFTEKWNDTDFRLNTDAMPQITVVLERNGHTALVLPMVVYVFSGDNFYVYLNTRAVYSDSTNIYNDYSGYVSDTDGVTIYLKPGYPADAEYAFGGLYANGNSSTNSNYGIGEVKYAVEGEYANAAAVATAVTNDPSLNIASELFADPVNHATHGHKANYSNGVTFSIVSKNDILVTVKVTMATSTLSISQDDAYLNYGSLERRSDYSTTNGVQSWKFTLEGGKAASDSYALSMTMADNYSYSTSNYGLSYVTSAVEGSYATADAVTQAISDGDVSEIKSQLFSSGGYSVSYGGDGKEFTVVDVNGELHHLKVTAVERKLYIDKNYVYLDNSSINRSTDYSETDDIQNWTFIMNAGYLASSPYGLYMRMSAEGEGYSYYDYYGLNFVKYAVVGNMADADAVDNVVAADSSVNIKNDLFSYNRHSAIYDGEGVEFTVVDVLGGVHHLKVKAVDSTSATLSVGFNSLRSAGDNVVNISRLDGDELFIQTLPDKAANGNYSLRLNMRGSTNGRYFSTLSGTDGVEWAAEGNLATADAVKAQTDIKDDLFSNSYSGGIAADYSAGKEFTILDSYGVVHHLKVTTVEGNLYYSTLYGQNATKSGREAAADNAPDNLVRSGFASEYYTIKAAHKDETTLYVGMNMRTSSDTATMPADRGLSLVTAAYEGWYASSADAVADGKADIKAQLFSDPSKTGGFAINVSTGQKTFTVVDSNGFVYNLTVGTASEYQSDETYFNIKGAKKVGDNTDYSAYVVNAEDVDNIHNNTIPDTYAYGNFGYQTLFLLDGGNAVTDTQLIPVFTTKDANMRVYANQDGVRVPVTSGTTPINFAAGEPVQFTAVSQDGMYVQNYWVTFVTQEAQPKLFIEATNYAGHYEAEEDGGEAYPTRQVYLIDVFGNHHDILIANLGSSQLTGVNVVLSDDAEGVTLDEYWTIRDDSTKTLGAFDSTSPQTMNNTAKIRLIAKEEDKVEEVSGKLTFTADDGTNVTVLLTGHAGNLALDEVKLYDGVKYVPYRTVIATNAQGRSAGNLKYEIVALGDDAFEDYKADNELADAINGLPEDLNINLNPNTGELYGVPLKAGTYVFNIKVTMEANGRTQVAESYEPLVLVIQENEDDIVLASNDDELHGLPIWKSDNGLESGMIADQTGTSYQQRIFVSTGDPADGDGEFKFVALYLDGEPLTEGEDYTTGPHGSIAITIVDETFEDKGNGKHTISAEFRNDDNEMKTTSQNYSANVSTYTPPQNPTSNPTRTPTPTPTPSPTPTPTQEPELGPVELEYDVSGTTVTLKDISQQKESELDETRNPNAEVDLTEIEPSVKTVIIPAEVADKLAEKFSDGSTQMGTLTIKLPDALIEFDEISMRAIATQDNGKDTRLNVEAITLGDLNNMQQAALEGQSVFGGVSITTVAGDTPINDFGGGRVSISIPFTIPNGYQGRDYSVFHIAEDGTLSRHASNYNDGYLTFRVSHFSEFVILYDPAIYFADISDNAWYTSSVDYVAKSGLMVGVGNDDFAPNVKLTRAMLAQILYNMEPDAQAPSNEAFSDVPSEAWYADAVNWAAEVEVVHGMGDGVFAPLEEITREQLAQMLYNYALYKGYDTSRSASLSRFNDVTQISSWAENAISWAVGEKLFTGVDAHTLIPKDGATRAQTAKVLTYFRESFEL